jgi:hypothetical protein
MATLPKPGRRKDNEHLAGAMSANRQMVELINKLINRLKRDELTTQELTFILIQIANHLAAQSHHLHAMDKIRLNYNRRSSNGAQDEEDD